MGGGATGGGCVINIEQEVEIELLNRKCSYEYATIRRYCSYEQALPLIYPISKFLITIYSK